MKAKLKYFEESELPEVAKMLSSAYPQYRETYFERSIRFNLLSQEGIGICAYIGPELVGFTSLTYRYLSFLSSYKRFAYTGLGIVKEKYRGKFIYPLLNGALLGELKDCDGFAGFSNRMDEYEKLLPICSVEKRKFIFSIKVAFALTPQISFQDISNESFNNELIDLYFEFNSDKIGSIKRTTAYLAYQSEMLVDKNVKTYKFEYNGQLFGYIRFRVLTDVLELLEYAFHKGKETAFVAGISQCMLSLSKLAISMTYLTKKLIEAFAESFDYQMTYISRLGICLFLEKSGECTLIETGIPAAGKKHRWFRSSYYDCNQVKQFLRINIDKLTFWSTDNY